MLDNQASIPVAAMYQMTQTTKPSDRILYATITFDAIIAMLTAAYFISPIDFIPDVLPPATWIDDLIVFLAAGAMIFVLTLIGLLFWFISKDEKTDR